MAYIYENTNQIGFQFKDLNTGTIFPSFILVFDGRSFYDLKNENKLISNINGELLVDPIGMRMEIKVEIINNTQLNNQNILRGVMSWMNMVHRGLYRVIIYPSYDATMNIDTLDKFECVMKEYYKIKKVHDFLKSGQQYTFTFVEYLPNQIFVPKVSSIESESNLTMPQLPGGGVA